MRGATTPKKFMWRLVGLLRIWAREPKTDFPSTYLKSTKIHPLVSKGPLLNSNYRFQLRGGVSTGKVLVFCVFLVGLVLSLFSSPPALLPVALLVRARFLQAEFVLPHPTEPKTNNIKTKSIDRKRKTSRDNFQFRSILADAFEAFAYALRALPFFFICLYNPAPMLRYPSHTYQRLSLRSLS